MSDRQLSEARQLANRLRFSRDHIQTDDTGSIDEIRHAREFAAGSYLRIDQAVTPDLARAVEAAAYRLLVPLDAVDAFVFAGSEIEADCFSPSAEGCIIRFSSALVELLNEEEFAFVVGHELGHFLLHHGLVFRGQRQQSVELLMVKRSQEISADRLGLLASDSIEIAVRALMKSASGLGDKHLRFDVSTFLSQLQSIGPEYKWHSVQSTHPSILVRCRALLWLGMHDLSELSRDSSPRDALLEIDKRVEQDLDRYIEGVARHQVQTAKADYLLWSFAYEVAQSGAFKKGAQDLIEQFVGTTCLDRLKEFMAATPAEEVEEEVYLRLRVARETLEEILPISFSDEVERLRHFVSKQMATLGE